MARSVSGVPLHRPGRFAFPSDMAYGHLERRSTPSGQRPRARPSLPGRGPSAGSPQTPPRCPHRCWPTSATLPTDQTPSAPTRTASPSSSAAATGGPLRTRTAVTLRALPARPRPPRTAVISVLRKKLAGSSCAAARSSIGTDPAVVPRLRRAARHDRPSGHVSPSRRPSAPGSEGGSPCCSR
jgi:hypothetical protein